MRYSVCICSFAADVAPTMIYMYIVMHVYSVFAGLNCLFLSIFDPSRPARRLFTNRACPSWETLHSTAFNLSLWEGHIIASFDVALPFSSAASTKLIFISSSLSRSHSPPYVSFFRISIVILLWINRGEWHSFQFVFVPLVLAAPFLDDIGRGLLCFHFGLIHVLPW